MSTHPARYDVSLPPDFADRLEHALDGADRTRRKRAWSRRLISFFPVVLLVGPIIGWRLTVSTPDGLHVVIAALAWVTFLLDVGVHVDTSILSYLGLSQLPSIVGILILAVLTYWLLSDRETER